MKLYDPNESGLELALLSPLKEFTFPAALSPS